LHRANLPCQGPLANPAAEPAPAFCLPPPPLRRAP
jgi:hypothetical protein